MKTKRYAVCYCMNGENGTFVHKWYKSKSMARKICNRLHVKGEKYSFIAKRFFIVGEKIEVGLTTIEKSLAWKQEIKRLKEQQEAYEVSI